ncbi:CTL-like protein 1 [Papilio machaon]|uniref:CTL-like protein 1 n=1 Tax=Papilio machaon TaxID=76193 RepID=A0A194R0T3_PAPMA|nr:CTL-like protein 1 [Papilio machaon]
MGCTQSEISPQNETPRKGCTDVLWLVIYIVFWILMLIIACISFVYGNPQRLINGYDSFGNTCGVKSNKKLLNYTLSGINTVDKPYLFFMDIKELRRSLKICVKQCPKNKLESLADIQNFYRETGSNVCRYDIDLNNVISSSALHNFIGPCPTLPVYESFPLLNRCFPKSAKEIAQKVFTDFYDLLNSWDTIEQMLSDLYTSWKEMIICVIIAFICSLIMVSILHLLATLVSWIFMILVSIVSIAGTGLLWYTYHELHTKQRDFSQAMFLAESFKNEKAFLWYSIIATIITVILLLLVWVMRSRVSFLATLFKETAHCLGSIPALFLQPIVTFFFLIIFFAFWSIVVVCLATANYPGIPFKTNFFINGTALPDRIDNAAMQAQTSLKYQIEFDPLWVKSMWWMSLVCLVWGSEFILGCQQMTIAGAVSHWYFRGPNAHPSPVLYSIGKLLKYHLGSVAKGSFLITLFKIPRLILTFLHAKYVCLATANYPGIPFKTNFFINGTALPDRIDNAAMQAQTSLKYQIEFDPLWVKSMWWMSLVCLVWGSEFILGCQQMTIAGAVSHWYLRGPNAHPSPVLYSIGKLLKYHLGSVAKGSFLITLFKIPRLILTYLHAKLSSRAEKGSECAKCGLKCGICCFYCLEKFIRYLNHNAYTIITIERCHFCKAAARAFSTIVNNALQVATINSVGDFILFLGKCIVTAVTGIIGLLLLKRNKDLHFFAVPTLFICIYSFLIAHCILSLYEMVVDSLFLCVCEDRNMNNAEGRWKSSRLAELGGHRIDKGVEQEGAELQGLHENAEGRWKSSRLAELGGHSQDKGVEQEGAELQDFMKVLYREFYACCLFVVHSKVDHFLT